MKNLKSSLRIIGFLAAAVFSAQTLPAATPIWSLGADGNWSVNGNWSTSLIPQTIDDVQFGNTGAGNQNTMDQAFTINSLTYNQDNQATHTTVLNSGFTLNINRGTAGDPLTVNSQTAAVTANTLLPVVIQGAGATMNVTGTGNIVVREGFSAATGAHMATLDMSALDTFNANVGRLLIGQANNGEVANRPSGTLILAKTNVVTLTSATAPQVMVQDGAQNANGGLASVLSLGQVTVINADNFRLGGQKGNGNVLFNPAFSSPSLTIRSHDAVSRAPVIVDGDNSFTSSGNNTVASVDLTAGSVDILVDATTIARGNPGPSTGTCVATLGLGAGTLDVNTLEIGFGIATGAGGATTGTLLVNNNGIVTTNSNSGLVSTGAVVVVNTTMRLARTNGGTGVVSGTLQVSGGTVMASSIIAGGGNSAITLNSGSSLVISNSAGTLSAPIRTFSISDAALTLPAQNAGAVLAVSNLVVGGSQNTINISSVPPIGSYPATFTLVSYKTETSAGGSFALGPLPAASPVYVGSLLDLGNGVIQLKLTAGPLADLSILWTGAQDNNWDTSTFNWSSHGVASNFFAGATPTLDDTSTQTNVNLATAISSGTVTVNDNVVQYDFSGPGNIAGASSLVKTGSKTLVIENQGIDNFGSVTVSGGTLQIGAGDVNGEISTLNITNNASMVVNRSGAINLGAAIAGNGSLTKLGNGTLTLSGANSYTGPTALNAGGLKIDGTLTGSGAITTAAGTVLSGSGSVGGPVTLGGTLNPGPVNGVGTFTAGSDLTLSSGSTATFDLDPLNTSASDTVAITGNLNLNNNAVTANFLGVPVVTGSYQLFTYSGLLAGNFNPTISGTHFTLTLDTSTPGVVNLVVASGTGANLTWTGATDTTWDSTVMNWVNGGTPSLFFSGDSVLMDDTAINPNLVIASGISVYPATITNNSDSSVFSISGAGKISGPASIVKLGASTLTIATPNDFTGTVDIQNGVLKAGNGTALGSPAAGTTVEPGGTLDIGGQSLAGEVITIAGDGFNSQGALINSGGIQGTAFRSLVLSSNASVGGTGQFAVNNAGGAASLSSQGQPFKLTKVGPNQFGLQNLAVDPALGDIEVQQGILDLNGSTASMGDPAHTNIVDAGATVQFTSGSVVWHKFFNFNGNGSATTVNNSTAAATELAGPTELHGGVVFNVGGTSLTISGDISSDGGIIKNGASPMILTGNNTYTGDTVINTGVLRVGGNATILSSNIIIAAGATLTATGRVDATFTLGANQTLSGNGVINGQLITLASSTLSPGLNAIGGLTVSNAVTLGGTNTFELDQDNKTNDVLNVNSGITYGGTLNLVNIHSALTNGASFKLFKALSYGGAFASIVPATPGAGLAWNTNTLTSGVISVKTGTVSSPTTNATITSVKAIGTNLVIHGTNNNVPNTNFHFAVLTSTNIAVPLSSWKAIATNSFNADGTFDYTNPIVTTTPQQFIDVQAVP